MAEVGGSAGALYKTSLSMEGNAELCRWARVQEVPLLIALVS